MNIEKMRADFEMYECVSDDGPQTDPLWLMYNSTTNEFPLDKIQERWKIWQASRAAIEVELPIVEIVDIRAQNFLNRAKVVSAIQAEGLKVKP